MYSSGPFNSSSLATDNLVWFDDFDLVTYDHVEIYEPVTVNHTLTVSMGDLDNGEYYAFMNNISWTQPKVPSLFSVLSAPSDELANNETIYGTDTHPIVLQHQDIVQIILNNHDLGKHPFDLHCHNFQVILRAPDQGAHNFVPYDPCKDDGNYPKYPMRRDTLVVKPNSHFLICFRADNPGVWYSIVMLTGT